MEKTSYYMSSMMLFNVFYIVRVLSLLDFSISINNYGVNEIMTLVNIGVASVCLIWGIIYTIIILTHNFNPQPGEGGKEYSITEKKNITSSEFLGKFSLLVLTGLTIGSIAIWWGLILYILFYVAIGIIFIRYNMLYVNIIMTLLGYDIYLCECMTNNKSETIYFVVNNIDIESNQKLTSTYTNKKIIRLKGNKNG
ncbi:MAG: hypothetical protein J1E81_09970 [Eubacterium sp.]|nr:hypothetical protein [Eubacterium sp.]